MVVVLIIAACAYGRFEAFQSLEPRMDHATMVTWVKAIFQSDHLLPTGDGSTSWIRALETDEDSFLHNLLKPIYTAPTLLFNFVSLCWFLLMALVSGPSSEAQIAASIIAHGGMLLVLALLPLEAVRSGKIGQVPALLLGALILLIAQTSSFLHLFSPLGTHNVGLFMLLLSTLVTSRYLHRFRTGQSGHAPLVWAILIQTLACYAMYANVFLIPPATVFALLFVGEQAMHRRIAEAARYSFFTFLSFIPALALLAIGILYPHSRNDIGSFSGMFEWAFASRQTTLPDYLSFNFLHWIETLTYAYSAPGLVLGGLGLILLARHLKMPLPLSLVVTHLLVWTGMALFANTRTPAYALPFFALGVAYLIYHGTARVVHLPMGRKKAFHLLVLAGVAGGLGWHYRTDIPRLADPKRSEIWGTYYKSQGLWRPVVEGIDQHLPDSTLIVPWNGDLSMMYRSLTDTGNFNSRVFRALETLSGAQDKGQLDTYINRRKLSLNAETEVQILVPGVVTREQLSSVVRETLCQPALLGCQHPRLEKVTQWPAPSYYGNEIAIYRLRPDKARR